MKRQRIRGVLKAEGGSQVPIRNRQVAAFIEALQADNASLRAQLGQACRQRDGLADSLGRLALSRWVRLGRAFGILPR